MSTAQVVVLIVILAAAAAGLFVWLRQRSNSLQTRFGPEYDRTVRQVGNKYRAESQLKEREKRVEKLPIHPLTQTDRERFSIEWRAVQADFVDDPEGSLGQADELVARVMAARGYPMTDFDRCAEDLSVDHGVVVDSYRLAHSIAVRRARGEATTEEIRQAMLHYRTLFEDLLPPAQPEQLQARHAAV
jgi:hypothetical protein